MFFVTILILSRDYMRLLTMSVELYISLRGIRKATQKDKPFALFLGKYIR